MTALSHSTTPRDTDGHDLLAIDLIRLYVADQMLSLASEDTWWRAFAAFYAEIVLAVPSLQQIAVEVATDRILASHGCGPIEARSAPGNAWPGAARPGRSFRTPAGRRPCTWC